ncbi:MAG: T9SS type A sorting domain-containing protein [Flavobacteriales bacterium]|nr:T9SS type A sorting domain-containing protein [Flavobacteriales bacterium]MDW8432510.1 T9SS type A sorting domain-containing protein [Flavobacteriales bacterium]
MRIFLACILPILPLQAQITIERYHLGILTNIQHVMAEDTAHLAVSPGNPGPAQTWDFSTLANHLQDTLQFMPPAGQPCASDFPTATFALKISDEIVYGKDDNNSLEFLGICSDPLGTGNVAIKMLPPERWMIFPLQFGSSWTDVSRLAVQIGTPSPPPDSIRVVSTVQRVNLVDGWGQVVTPLVTQPCLRVKTTIYQVDSVFIKVLGVWTLFGTPEVTEDTEYNYFPQNGFPAVSLSINNTDGQLNFVKYSLTTNASTPSEALQAEVTVGPNPLQGGPLQVRGATPGSRLMVYDMEGRCLGAFYLPAAETYLEVPDWQAGVYLYRIVSEKAETMQQGRLVLMGN